MNKTPDNDRNVQNVCTLYYYKYNIYNNFVTDWRSLTIHVYWEDGWCVISGNPLFLLLTQGLYKHYNEIIHVDFLMTNKVIHVFLYNNKYWYDSLVHVGIM